MEKIEVAKGIVFTALLALVVAAYAFPLMQSALAGWYDPMVSPQEIEAMLWVDKNIPHGSLFAADLFACESLTMAARMVCSIGGAWELADRPNERFWDTERIFNSSSGEEAWRLLRKWGIQYVFVYYRISYYGFGYKYPSLSQFEESKYFTSIYSRDGVKIYKVN